MVTPAINSLISMNPNEADAGAGGGKRTSPDVVDIIQETGNEDGGLCANEVDHHQLAEDNDLTLNGHRAALLEMLAGDTSSPEEAILASMLLATILENDEHRA